MAALRFATLGMLTGLGFSAAAQAQVFNYNFTLSGLQEVPPNASPGIGNAAVTLDTATNMLSWNISFSGLLGTTVTGAHFHAPAPPGVNAPIVLDIGAISGLSSPMIGMMVVSNTVESNILAGLTYVNIHTNLFPGGEIRGQVIPTPGALALLGAAGLVALRRPRR